MQYQYLATNQLDTFIMILMIILTLSFILFLASTIVKRIEKFFVGSLAVCSITIGVALLISNINMYADNFSMSVVNSMRYEAYGGFIASLLIYCVNFYFWKKK